MHRSTFQHNRRSEYQLSHLGNAPTTTRECLLPEVQSIWAVSAGGGGGGHLCLLILCERDYRCDTFGLGEEHLHKVWREVSRRKTRLMNRGKRSSNLTEPEVGIQLRVGDRGGERDYFNVTWCAGITLGPICEWKQRNSRLMCRAEVSPVRGWKETL